MIRPAEHVVHADGRIVVIDGWVCALLNKISLDKVRRQVRGQNAQLDQVLMAIRLVGLAHTESSSAGTALAPPPEPVSESNPQLNNDTVSTNTAADVLSITDRAVRKAIAEKRLSAIKFEGRYRINREDLAAFMADRM